MEQAEPDVNRLVVRVAAFDVSGAEDVAVVLRARALRRRLRLLLRVLKALMVLLFVSMCGLVINPPAAVFRCRSMQSEAKGNLKALYVAEESYRGECDVYDGDLKTISYEPKGARVRYRYVVTDVDNADPAHASFRAWAFRTAGDFDDVWSINSNNELVNEVNGCQ
jgi:hypothetical protein